MSSETHSSPFSVGPYIIGGSNQGVLFDDAGTLANEPAFTWDKNEKVLTVFEPTKATIDVLRGSTPHPAWCFANHLVFVAGEESTGGGTIAAVAHAHDDPTTSPEFTGYRSRGTLENPQPVGQGDRLIRYASVCWDGASFGAGGMSDFYAAENWAPGRHGTYFVMRLTERGQASSRPTMIVDDRGAIRLPLATGRIEVGQDAATIGAIGLPNNKGIAGRTTTGQNVLMMFLDQANAVRIGSSTASGVTLDVPSGGLRINNQVNAAGAQTGTLGNSPAAGDPTFWLPLNIGGTVRRVPCW